ncbi:MAG: class I SAM-dependent methyltransferase [Alphaproteobacteria bacterium HGW-Alphaproteobacteria-5]|nr:MAG: class I SAM-dependent methyltransferase [Alphaproteobacteria bacterium HGW-Alphaproteobacteria-5]
MRSGGQRHWNDVYDARAEDKLTWFEATPLPSQTLVEKYLTSGGAFIDVGGGASRLADVLLDNDFGPLTVLDISVSALAVSKECLGIRGEAVTWIAADVRRWQPDREYDLWHDRAAFHFLTEPDERTAYAHVMSEALRSGGTAIIATFADDGPEICSGLAVARYIPEELAREFDRIIPGQLAMIGSGRHMHVTPKGNWQSFQYSVFTTMMQKD